MKATERFTGRVENYRQHRPRYPEAIVDLLHAECGLTVDSRIADVAAGTGLLAESFLARAYNVIAVEPNDEMRAACSTLMGRFLKLQCLAGTAEDTGLPAHSINMITVGQAMHWFDLKRTRDEFVRVLRPGGWCAVIYNHRKPGGDAFHDEYERLLQTFGLDYASVCERHLTPQKLKGFFAPCEMKQATFPNAQSLDIEGLEGRILSSSYMPSVDHADHAAMRAAIAELFHKHEREGKVSLEYECVVCYGQLS
ncbi:MAG TPA: class I SAM-dependent methyltransferase [Alloacidobacterium sp.]|jgi:SAM-dependent methyltransferase|nr:class I SAM-dependent methyltransferase [Alloacidobacterium sp.]